MMSVSVSIDWLVFPKVMILITVIPLLLKVVLSNRIEVVSTGFKVSPEKDGSKQLSNYIPFKKVCKFYYIYFQIRHLFWSVLSRIRTEW